MKKLIYGTLFLALVGIGFTSCEKENLSNSVINSEVNITNNNIPTFDNMEEVHERLDLLSKMGEDERRAYEKENDSKSLLTEVYEVYEGIGMENLDSRVELEDYIAQHPSILSLKANIDKELEYRPYFSDNHYSTIANKNRLFIVGDICFKVFDDGLVSAPKSNMSLLSEISEISVKDVPQTEEITISHFNLEESTKRASCNSYYNGATQTSGKQRTKVFVTTGIYPATIDDIVFLSGKIRPYKKTLGIWYHAKRTISGRFDATAIFFNTIGQQTLTLDDNVPPTLAYSVSISQLDFDFIATRPKITTIDSWGDTPSTSTVTVICN